MQIAFKVDVDTKRGLEQGVPNLLGIFKDLGIRASFFVPMGPDRTGRTIRRIFTKPKTLSFNYKVAYAQAPGLEHGYLSEYDHDFSR